MSKTGKDLSTEEKIKEAAQKVFTQKGYAATRTRDIAEEADINLALLNYYFRSKEKLFQIIMAEKLQKLFGIMVPIVNEHSTSLVQKVELIVDNYFTLLRENPDLPLFVLSEIRNHPVTFDKQFKLGNMLKNSVLLHQIQDRKPRVDPLQIIMNLIGMIVFPFIARPILYGEGQKQQKAFDEMLKQRKKMIPRWVEKLFTTT